MDQRGDKAFSDLNATGREEVIYRTEFGGNETRGPVGNVRPSGIVARGAYGGENDSMWRETSAARSTSAVRNRGKRT